MTEASVRAEQIRTLYGQSVPVLLANVINAAIVSAALWRSGPRPLLAAFVAAMALMTLVRVGLRRRYWRARPSPEQAGPWGRRFVAGSIVAGALWGAAGALFFDPQNVTSQVLIPFIVGGMGAGAAGTLGCYLPAFFGYMVPSVLPLLIRCFTIGDMLHGAMGTMMIVYGFALSAVARTTNRSITEAFRLRFENDQLVVRLSDSQRKLEEINRTLEQRVAERSAILEKQSEALREAQRLESVGRLAGGIAHDFNNLLTVVLAHAAIMLQEDGLDPGQRSAIGEVKKAAVRGADLVRQLLAFSRRQRLTPRVVDLHRVVKEMQRLLHPLIGEHIEVRLALAAGPGLVRADPTQLEQVMVNLATNARDAMPRGGVLTISSQLVEAEGSATLPRGSYVVLSVADTGVGMDESTRQRAFEPFFTTKGIGQGTGLGLATVYGVVDQSGGYITIDSAPGAGTEIKIYLPRAQEKDADDEAAEAAVALPTGRATVLVAEDEPDVRSVLERMLRLMGHEVLSAPGAEQALALARAHDGPIDLLVTDVVMTGRSGPDLASALAVERPGLRVLFVSGYSADAVLPPSDPGGGIDYLAKPMSLDALQSKVAGLLAHGVPAAAPSRTLPRTT